jgi:hypothetical protein
MAVALRGNLRDFGISDVLQLIGQQRKTGMLEVHGFGQRLHVHFIEGAVTTAITAGPHDFAALGDMLARVGALTPDQLAAIEQKHESTGEDFFRLLIHDGDLSAQEIEEIEDLVTSETLFALLRASEGSFHFSAQPVAPRRAGRHLPAEQILMDGLRMVDEWLALDEDARREEIVFRTVGQLGDFQPAPGHGSRAERDAAQQVFEYIDGKRTVRRVIDLARVGTFEGARALSSLRSAGLIEPCSAVSPEARRKRPLPLRKDRALSLALGAIPFLLLMGVLYAIPQRGPEAPATLQPDLLTRTRISFEARRVRRLVEVHRFATGSWPDSLDDLVARGWLEPAAAERLLALPGGDELLVLARDFDSD